MLGTDIAGLAVLYLLLALCLTTMLVFELYRERAIYLCAIYGFTIATVLIGGFFLIMRMVGAI